MNKSNKLSFLTQLPLVNRRRFLTGAVIGTAGIIFLPKTGMTQPVVPPVGWLKFFKTLGKFAAKVGLGALGINPNELLGSTERTVKKEVDDRLRELFQRGYKAIDQVYAGDGVSNSPQVAPSAVLMPFEHPSLPQVQPDASQLLKGNVVAVFDPAQRKWVYGYTLKAPTVLGLPQVADDLENEFAMNAALLFKQLVPVSPRSNDAFYNLSAPDTFFTRGGFVDSRYIPSQNNLENLLVNVQRVTNIKSGKSEPIFFTGREPGRAYSINTDEKEG